MEEMIEAFNDRAINLLHYLFDDVKQSDLEGRAICFFRGLYLLDGWRMIWGR